MKRNLVDLQYKFVTVKFCDIELSHFCRTRLLLYLLEAKNNFNVKLQLKKLNFFGLLENYNLPIRSCDVFLTRNNCYTFYGFNDA